MEGDIQEIIEEPKLYSITLSDGTVISNLTMNGNNFVAESAIDESIFEGNCGTVLIYDGETTVELSNMEFQKTQIGDNEDNMFILYQITDDELQKIKLQSDIEYIAMMAGIEL